MGELRETARHFVEELLDSHKTASSSRSDVHFDNLVVVGCGQGVSGARYHCCNDLADNWDLQVQAAPTVWTTIKSWANVLNPRSYSEVEPERTLLYSLSGSLLGGEMLLVIGSPGSGCTTFLKALANMRDEYKGMSGKITYGGRPAHDRDPDGVRLTFCGKSSSTPVCLGFWILTLSQPRRTVICPRSRWRRHSGITPVH